MTLEGCQHTFHKQCIGETLCADEVPHDKQACPECKSTLSATDTTALKKTNSKILNGQLRKELLNTIPVLALLAMTVCYGVDLYSLLVGDGMIIPSRIAQSMGDIGPYVTLPFSMAYLAAPILTFVRLGKPENMITTNCARIHNILLKMKNNDSAIATKLLTSFEWFKNLNQAMLQTKEGIKTFLHHLLTTIQGFHKHFLRTRKLPALQEIPVV